MELVAVHCPLEEGQLTDNVEDEVLGAVDGDVAVHLLPRSSDVEASGTRGALEDNGGGAGVGSRQGAGDEGGRLDSNITCSTTYSDAGHSAGEGTSDEGGNGGGGGDVGPTYIQLSSRRGN